MKFKKPTLLIDEVKARRNIDRIVKKAVKSDTSVWPHFKTHQSLQIGEWFKDSDISGITVSSVSMAEYFANAQWPKIYIAFPVNINEIDEISELAERVSLTLLVNDPAHVNELIKRVTKPVNLKIEIETGSRRSGIASNETELIRTIIDQITVSQHVFGGFYSHFGHTYGATNRNEVRDIFDQSFAQLKSLEQYFISDNPAISLGDTPSASVLDTYNDISSMHAGNYVFYDLTQAQIGVCEEEEIAIVLAAPVVSKNRERLELVVYGGGIHLSKDQLKSREFGNIIYGKIVTIGPEGWSASLENCYVRSISQEHGVIKVTSEVFDQFAIGDSLGILPVHSCMTADCMGEYYSLQGMKLDHLQGKSPEIGKK